MWVKAEAMYYTPLMFLWRLYHESAAEDVERIQHVGQILPLLVIRVYTEGSKLARAVYRACKAWLSLLHISVAARIHFAVIYTHVNWGMYIVYRELLFGAVPNFWLRAHGNWLGSRPFCFFLFDVWSFVVATATPSPVALQYCLFLLSFINFIGFRRIQAGLVRGA